MKIIIGIFFACLLTPPNAISDDLTGSLMNDDKVLADTLNRQREIDPDRPQFPPIDEVKNIKNRRGILERTGFNVYIGFAAADRNNDDLNSSYESMESAYGINSHIKFPGSGYTVHLGLRLRMPDNVNLLWEYFYGGDPSDNRYSYSTASLSALYAINPAKGISLLIGPGYALQRIRASRSYYLSLSSDGTYLERLKLDSGRQWGVPLTAFLEIRPNIDSPRFSLFVSMRYMMGPSTVADQQLPYGDQIASLKIDMTGTRLSAGIGLGF